MGTLFFDPPSSYRPMSSSAVPNPNSDCNSEAAAGTGVFLGARCSQRERERERKGAPPNVLTHCEKYPHCILVSCQQRHYLQSVSGSSCRKKASFTAWRRANLQKRDNSTAADMEKITSLGKKMTKTSWEREKWKYFQLYYDSLKKGATKSCWDFCTINISAAQFASDTNSFIFMNPTRVNLLETVCWKKKRPHSKM